MVGASDGAGVGAGDMVGNHVPSGKVKVKAPESAQTVVEPISQTRNWCMPVVPPGSRSSMTISVFPTHSQGSSSLDSSSLHLKK